MKTTKLLFFTILLLLSINFDSFSQVGIGTTSPDASSILDITSTTQGVLAPRMTTSQRNAIVTPAVGLLVFDTDENVFYFYDGSTWMPLESAEKRNNYKLIKSAADLATELAAGSGTEYLLDENTLYEVNGTINLAAPINLNDAYIIGLDVNEDILLRSGGTIFSGSSGGAIKNLTLVAPGGSIFNLTGSGTENLIFRDCIVANSASVGNVSSFGLVFLSIVQFVNNTTGITYTDINKLLLNNTAWDGTNDGIYETLIGDFDEIAKQGGFSEVVGATAAVDITGITSISGSAGLGLVNFFGGGNYINGSSPYTGYDFTSYWDVNCPGIPVETDGAASGNFYYNGTLTTGFTQTINSGTAVEVQGSGTFTTDNLFRFISAGGSNRLVYDGLKPRSFQVSASLSIRVSGAAGNFYAFLIAKNGTVITESNVVAYIDNDTQIQNIAINVNVNLDNGDYIEVFTQRLTGGGSDTLVVFSENLSIK